MTNADSNKILIAFKVSFAGEEKAREYLVYKDAYTAIFKAILDPDVGWLTFKPYGFTREVSLNKSLIQRIMW